MAKKNYNRARLKTHVRLAVDIPKALYRDFRKSRYRTEAVTDAEGLRQLLYSVLRKEQ